MGLSIFCMLFGGAAVGGTGVDQDAESSSDEASAASKDSTPLVNIQNNRMQTALHIACLGGNVGVVKALVNAGTDVNLRDIEGRTALHNAVIAGHAAVAKFLEANGADVSIRDNDGRTAYECAVADPIA